jgi:FecR protein
MSERDQSEFGAKMLEHLPLAKAPDSIWPSIEAALDQNPIRRPSRVPPWRWAFAAAAAMVLLALLYWRATHRIQWIETDDHSRVTVKVGEIGSVEVEPGTRLRVVTERPNEHRFALAHGAIRATISAPPKLFFVDTASGTAVDLGCEYALNANELGLGLLQVTKGWVSFQWKGMESLVPAGASCRTHPGTGPGIPYFDDAPEILKQALENLGNEKDGGAALDVILATARVRDTLTLWHLLQRVDVSDRARVYDRIAALTPVPAGVSRQRALQLDPATLRLWKDELAWKW